MKPSQFDKYLDGMNTQTGFTITELIVVMAIVAILTGIGVPSYRYVTTANRVSSEVNGLLGDMQYARSEAVREGQTVTVCAANTDGTDCLGDGNTSWKGGWIVFSDANGDKSVQSATEPVLRVKNAFAGQDTFTSAVNAVTFNREGFAVALPNAGVLLTLHDSTSTATYTRCLQITFVGTVKTVTHTTLPACT
jgi:type IV fimbrial biogenesis protein FimT